MLALGRLSCAWCFSRGATHTSMACHSFAALRLPALAVQQSSAVPEKPSRTTSHPPDLGNSVPKWGMFSWHSVEDHSWHFSEIALGLCLRPLRPRNPTSPRGDQPQRLKRSASTPAAPASCPRRRARRAWRPRSRCNASPSRRRRTAAAILPPARTRDCL